MSIVLYEKPLNLIILQYNIVIGVIIPHRYNFQKRAYLVISVPSPSLKIISKQPSAVLVVMAIGAKV